KVRAIPFPFSCARVSRSRSPQEDANRRAALLCPLLGGARPPSRHGAEGLGKELGEPLCWGEVEPGGTLTHPRGLRWGERDEEGGGASLHSLDYYCIAPRVQRAPVPVYGQNKDAAARSRSG